MVKMQKIIHIRELLDTPDSGEKVFEYLKDLLMTEDYEKIVISFRDTPKLKEEVYEIMIGELYGWFGWDYLSETLRYRISKSEHWKLNIAIQNAKTRYFKNAPQTKETRQTW
mgnify:FL=1